MPTNTQLQAEIDRLNQAMAERARVASNLPKFTGKRGEDVREWLFQIENACRINGVAIGDASGRAHHVLQHFEASNYQSVLREKLQRLKQTADIETYNGEYSALIFRVDDMGVLDQVLLYANGLKPRARSYVKLENPETLSDALDLTVKFEATHFVEDTSERKVRHVKMKTSNEQAQDNKKTKGTIQTEVEFEEQGDSYLPLLQQAWPHQRQLLCVEEGAKGAGKREATSVKESPVVEEKMKETSKMLLDCGATTIYVSKRLAEEHQLKTTKFSDKNIRVNLGDNPIVEAQLEVPSLLVYAIPEEFDCILGILFFEDMQPQIDWRRRRVEGTRERTLRWERAGETCGPIEEGGPVIASGLRRSVGAKGLWAKRHDSCRGAALETDVKSAVNPVHDSEQNETQRVACEQLEDASAGKGSASEDERKSSGRNGTAPGGSDTKEKESVVEKMFTMGITDGAGVENKFITRKKLRKFLRIKTKSIDEPDFMLVLTNETIKNVARSLERRDQPDNVGTANAQRYLETDWQSFRANPAFDLLTKYKDTVFQPELPEGLPEKREIEHRIDVKDPNLAMYRQQWRQSPEQQREIVLWVEDMTAKIKTAYTKDREAKAIFTAIQRRADRQQPKAKRQQKNSIAAIRKTTVCCGTRLHPTMSHVS
ncbi:hypothetical protein P3T76_014010 [Phytophthora citrophthora]|uniref:Ty3 transposon capsid-like protein domain-containing protein n=1 Tax=Phytophthora citrophthora TaxID=4793 RepID=A0AAD9LCI7_9STRA|nr:hypothetical protein P3T76_014010 [Phytophthora citrophthora]